MLSYQVLLAAALLILCKPRAIVCQDLEVQPVNLEISPSSPVDVGSSGVSFTCSTMVNCTGSMECMNDTVAVTWMKDQGMLDVSSQDYIFPMSPKDLIQPGANSSTPVSFILMTNGAVKFSHGGLYECVVSLSGSVMSVLSSGQTLTVQFPSNFLSVSLTPSNPVGVVGSPITLTCTAMLSVDVPEAMFDFGYTFMENSVRMVTGIMQNSDDYSISPVQLSSAGEYTCTVTVRVTDVCGGGSEPACPTLTSDAVNLTVQFPSQLISSVVLTPVNQTRAVGSSISFTCTAVLAVDVLGAMIVFSFFPPFIFDTISMAAVAGVVQEANATISSVTLSSVADYSCGVTVIADGVCASPDCPALISDTVALAVTTISPDELIRLDISPYNAFDLACTLTSPVGSSFMTTFYWNEENEMVPGNTTLSLSSVSLSPFGGTVTNTLAVMLKPIAPETTPIYIYECMAGVVGGNLATVSAMVTVRGPVSPNPSLLGAVTTFPERAIIQFTVSSFAYDPENYTIMLATDTDNLTTVNGILSTSDPTDLSFLTATNISYTIDVDGLVIFQKYYYVIVATNSAGSTNSTLGNFTTSEAPPGPPSNPVLRIDMADSLYLSWDKPNEPNGNITEYRYSCHIANNEAVVVQAQAGLMPNVTSAIITGTMVQLTPFTSYTCRVFASTLPGEGPLPANATGRSASAIPSGIPQNFNGMSTNPTILILSWDEPEESKRNGDIIGYVFFCNGVHSVPQVTQEMTEAVTGLTAYQEYECRVGATTANGTGPSAAIVRRTAEDIPDAVNSLTVNGISTQFSVRWREPTITNGMIVYYYVLIYNAASTDKSFVVGQNAPGTSTSLVISQLDMFVPYNVTVFAATSAGNGTSTSVIDFTEEGLPGGVAVVDINRINGTHMTVTWDPLTLEEARGFVTHYTVMAIPTDELRKRQDSGTVSADFSSTASSGTVGGLESRQDYGVIVVGNTVAEAGQEYPAILVPAITTSNSVGEPTGGSESPDGTLAIAISVPVTAVLCSVPICLVGAIAMYFCIMRKKAKRNGKEEQVRSSAGPEAVYDMPQFSGRSSSDMELKGNICYASKSDVC